MSLSFTRICTAPGCKNELPDNPLRKKCSDCNIKNQRSNKELQNRKVRINREIKRIQERLFKNWVMWGEMR